MGFPVMRLVTLLISSASRPFIQTVREKALQSDFVRNKLIIGPAQKYNTLEKKLQMKTKSLSGIIVPLTEEKALQLGSTLITEFLMFSMAVALTVWQFSRQNSKEIQSRIMEEEERNNIMEIIKNLTVEMEKQDKEIEHITKEVRSLRAHGLRMKHNSMRGSHMLL